jgi:hypothetical protein
MSILFRKYSALQVFFVLAVFIVTASRCVSSSETQPDLRGEGYAGAARCQTCHAAIYESHAQTAHAQTSQPPSRTTIKGSFDSVQNSFVFSDEWKVMMEQHPGGFYQTAYRNGKREASHPFSIVMGSGRKAQTYLYFDSGSYYQLPISFFVPEHTWANSPNFPANAPKFDRPIPSGCFGCHSSGVGMAASYQGMQKQEVFEKGKVIYGIDCERCHGPAAAHVAYQEEHPEDKTARYIASFKGLNRQQQVDLCGICHSGTKNMQKPAFAFQPGEVREDYFYPDYGSPLPDQLDVHGNQYALMKASACYMKSQTLTCGSCHSPHKKEREDFAGFSQRCITCHQQVDHSFIREGKLTAGEVNNNCIDCHMPLKASSAITLLTKQKTAAKADSIRTHLVKVY